MRSILCLIAGAIFVACSKADDAASNAAVPESAITAGAPAATTPESPSTLAAIDPCTFITKEELEEALGYTLQPGKQQTSEPSCRFVSRTGGSVTIAIPTLAVSDAEFRGWQQTVGAEAEPVGAVGDAAYFWGSRIYVRKGTRTFTVSIADRQLTPQIRAALTKLGQLGASKLP